MFQGKSLIGVKVLLPMGTWMALILTQEEAKQLIDDWHSGVHDPVFEGDSQAWGLFEPFRWSLKAADVIAIHTFNLSEQLRQQHQAQIAQNNQNAFAWSGMPR